MEGIVTGGTGFLGSHLVDALLRRGLSVCAIDDGSGPSHWDFSSEGLRAEDDLVVWAGDARDNSWWQAADHGKKPRFIFACASPGSCADFERDPVRTVTSNVVGLANCIEIAERTGATVVFISSSEAYGFSYGPALLEGQTIICKTNHYRATYEEGKRAGEAMLLEKVARTQVKGAVARLFTVYGPRLGTDRRMMSEFIVRALRGEPLEIDGKGSQITTACYISDAVDQLMTLAEAAEAQTISNLPVNVGSAQGMTVSDCAERIIKILGSDSGISHLPARPFNPEIRVPDMSVMWGLKGHGPKVAFDTGVRFTAEFYLTHDLSPEGVWRHIKELPV